MYYKRFSASSERYPGQHELFDEAEYETADEALVSEEPPEVEVASHTKKKPERKPLPEQLPRVDVIHDLTEDEKICAHDGHALHKIGEAVSEQLDIIPARIQVILHIDETRVQVLAEDGKTASSQSHAWVTRSGGTDPPIIWYQHEPGRGRKVPIRLLQDFKGHLVTDGYAGYKAVTAGADNIGVGCWAHARRKFDEALKVQGGKKAGRVQSVLSEIGKLYAIERDIKAFPTAKKHAQRQDRAKPVILKLRIWLTKTLPEVAPKTALGKALRYLDSEWPRLVHYLDNGELPIDNNTAVRLTF